MDTFKEVISFAGAVIGLLAALIPLCAHFADRRRQVARSQESPQEPQPVPRTRVPEARPAFVAVEEEPPPYVPPPRHDPARVARAKALVKQPAIALLMAGTLGLASNLLVAAFGFVDQFVTPLTTESQARRQAELAGMDPVQGQGPLFDNRTGPADDESTSTVLGIITLLSFSVASGMAIWAGYNMLRLKSHWLSIAGSFAVMPAMCLCCFAGLPIGLWSLSVLIKPEVSSAFH